MFSASSQFFIMSPILPQICRQLKVDESLLGFLITAYSFSLGIVALFAGYISDKIGRRKILLLGSSLMTVSLFFHYLAYNFYSILIIRIITGIAGGILTGSCISFVRDYYPYKKRGFANGIIASGSGIGQIVGIPIGVILGDKYGFASSFIIFGIVMLIAFVFIYLFIPKMIPVVNQVKFQPKKIIKGYFNILKQPVYSSLSFIYILMYFSITIFLVYFPKWITVVFKGTANEIAYIFFIGGIASLIASPIAGKCSDVFGRKKVAIVTNVLFIIAMSVGVLISSSIIQSTILFFFAMLSITGRLVSIQSHTSDITSSNNRGQVICLMISVGQIGMGIGSGIAGYIFSEFGFQLNLILTAITSSVLVLLILKSISFNNLKVVE
jgi:predicted MFS family arabinose efflux permease